MHLGYRCPIQATIPSCLGHSPSLPDGVPASTQGASKSFMQKLLRLLGKHKELPSPEGSCWAPPSWRVEGVALGEPQLKSRLFSPEALGQQETCSPWRGKTGPAPALPATLS